MYFACNAPLRPENTAKRKTGPSVPFRSPHTFVHRFLLPVVSGKKSGDRDRERDRERDVQVVDCGCPLKL